MKSVSQLRTLSVIALGLIAQNGLADTTVPATTTIAPAGASTTVAPAAAATVASPISFRYAIEVRGPGLSNLGSGFNPDTSTGEGPAVDSSSPVFADHILSAGYKLSDAVRLSLVGYYRMQLARRDVLLNKDTSSTTQNQMLDPYVGINLPKVITLGKMTIDLGLRQYLPLSESARDLGLITSSRLTQAFNLPVDNSPFSISVNTFAQLYLFSDNPALYGKQRDLRLYANPNIDYSISDSVTASLGYEMEASVRKTLLLKTVFLLVKELMLF